MKLGARSVNVTITRNAICGFSSTKIERVIIFFLEESFRGCDMLAKFLVDAELKALMSNGYNVYIFIRDELKTTSYKDIGYRDHYCKVVR